MAFIRFKDLNSKLQRGFWSTVDACAFTTLVLGILCLPSCRRMSWLQNSEDQEEKGNAVPEIAAGRFGVEKLADSSPEIAAIGAFYLNLWNKNFTARLPDLPTSGSVPTEKIPYSGYWYPRREHGTNYRPASGGLSPLGKYDRSFNAGQSKAADWEEKNHTAAANSEEAAWAGHCNGFSAAAQRHMRPKKSVVKNGVTFEIQDIKALLAEIHMSAKYLFLGGRRCENDQRIPLPGERPDPTKINECQDINPGTFHAAVANWIGIAKHTVIFDDRVSSQVWNYPMYAYQSTVTAMTLQDALKEITGSRNGSYRFNPTAVKFSFIDMTVTFADAAEETSGTTIAKTQRYTYILELNDKDEIIGGEWVRGSVSDHPDFLWVAFEPVLANGSSAFGNPHVDPAQVIRLWAESIGADPNNPPLDILEPKDVSNWGKYANFELTLDSSTTGAAFLGKPLRLTIARLGNYIGKMTLDLSVDGGPLPTYSLDGDTPIIYDFTSSTGLHRLDLVWKKADTVQERVAVNFHVNP